MASSMDKLAKELKKQMTASDGRKPKPYDTQAEVLRVEDGVAWVHIPGGVDETPVRLTINAKKGDNVNLHVANGTAWITGNSTNPPTDDSTANYAVNISNEVKKDVMVLNTVVAENIEATNARFTNVEADTAKIHDLTADNLHATVGYIEDLTADSITAQDISASSGYIKDLKSNSIEADTIVADHATVGSLDSNYAHIKNGVIDNAKINYADVNDLSAHYAEIQNGYINSALINTAAIVDEQVFTVSGNKATIKEINADNINVRNLNAKNLKIETADGYVTIGDKKTPTKEFIDSLTNELNDRIDGAIETYTSTVVPTLSNYPANAWDTDEVKATHVGDVCYVVNDQIAQNGYCYRFTLNGTTFSWQLIKDSDVTAALSRLTTAEGKIGNIEEFDEDIATFKTETEGEISTLQTKTTTLETSLGDKVDKTVFNEVKQTVEGNSSSITTLSETTTILRDDLNSLSVGGRNLLKNTEQQRVTPASANNSAYVSPVPRLTDYGLSMLNNTETWWTYSFDYEVTGNTADTAYIDVQLKGSQASGGSAGFKYVKDEPLGHFSYSCKLTSSQVSATSDSCNIRLRYATDGAVLTAKNLKLEKGNKETDWTPAPEDMGETVTTISNTVNEVKQTGTTNSSHISKLTQTLGTNADGSTKSGDVMHQVSDVVQDLSGFKTTVSETYATKDRLAAAETKITQNTNDISLTAEKSVHMSKPNLSPFFQSTPFTTSAGYWTNVTSSFTPLEDGWAHFLCDNTSGTDTVGNLLRMVSCPSVFDGESYTCLVEIRNLVSNAQSASMYTQQSAVGQFWGSTSTGGFGIANDSMTNGSYYMPMTALGVSEHGTSGTRLMYINWQVPAGAKIEADIRISLYEGEYTGEYKPYVGSQMYVSQSELKVTADGISLEVSKKTDKDTIISTIRQSAESVQIKASQVEIDGTATFNAIKSSADAAYDAKGAADSINVGGRNLWAYGSDCQNSLDGLNNPSNGFSIVTEDGYKCAHASGALKTTKYLQSKIGYIAKPSETFTYSCYVKIKNIVRGSTNPMCEFYFSGQTIDGSWKGLDTYKVYLDGELQTGLYYFDKQINDTKWHHFAVVVTYDNANFTSTFLPNVYFRDCTGDLYVRNLKAERGNKATDWTPAPEDVQSEIDAKKSVHTLDTTYSYTYAQILTYSAEGYSGTWTSNGALANGVKKGDTVRLKVTVSNMNDAEVYVVGTVTAVTTNSVTMTSHGLDTTVIDGGNILTNSIKALQIDTGAITADELAANAVTASKLAIGDFNNYITVNENNENTLVSGFVIEDGWLYKNVATASNAWLSPVLARWGKEGDQFRVTGKVKTNVAGRVRVLIYGRTDTGTVSGSAATAYVTTAANTETEFSGTIKISSTVAAQPQMNIVIQFAPPSGTSGYIVGYCKEMRCERIGPYITQINENGIRIHPAATENNSVVINASGMEVFKGGTESEYSVAKYGDTTRVGKTNTRHIEIKDGGVQVYQDANRIIGHFGYGLGTDENGTETVAPYFSLGIRPDNSTVGNYSVAEGYESIASGYVSHAEGFRTTTTVNGYGAHTEGYNTTAGARGAHAEGGYTTASGQCAHAEGGSTTASGDRSFAGGIGTIANGNEQMAIGRYNVADTTSLFIIGNGYDGGRSNAFAVGASGDVTIPNDANYQGGHSKTNFTPSKGSNYSGYGGCYYEKFGSVVHVHVGVSGLTANTATNIKTLPIGFRPSSTVFAHGTGGSWNNLVYLQVDSSGVVMVRSEGTYCGADITFMV